MTTANMAAHKDSEWYDFWKNLKEGYDYFEVTHLPPRVAVCEKHYLINAAFVDRGARPDPSGACPAWQRLPISRAPAQQEAKSTTKKDAGQRAWADLRAVQACLPGLYARPCHAGSEVTGIRNLKLEIRTGISCILISDFRVLTSDH